MSQQTNWELVITLDLLYSFLYFSAHTWFSYIFAVIIHHLEGLFSWLVSSVGKTLHRYRRGHGFKSHKDLICFQVLFQLQVQKCS